jgi:hypothetical protein
MPSYCRHGHTDVAYHHIPHGQNLMPGMLATESRTCHVGARFSYQSLSSAGSTWCFLNSALSCLLSTSTGNGNKDCRDYYYVTVVSIDQSTENLHFRWTMDGFTLIVTNCHSIIKHIYRSHQIMFEHKQAFLIPCAT